jgi:hypothetical protein
MQKKRRKHRKREPLPRWVEIAVVLLTALAPFAPCVVLLLLK